MEQPLIQISFISTEYLDKKKSLALVQGRGIGKRMLLLLQDLFAEVELANREKVKNKLSDLVNAFNKNMK